MKKENVKAITAVSNLASMFQKTSGKTDGEDKKVDLQRVAKKMADRRGRVLQEAAQE